MTGHDGKELWLASLRADGPAMRAVFEEATATEDGLQRAVPSCPGWTLLDLLQAVATGYYEVRSHVSRGVTSIPEPVTPPELPTGAAAVQWFTDEFDALVTLLDALDPELPAWNWAPQVKQAWFWQRRMAHETALRRWDAQSATGHMARLESTLAADGVQEVLDTWLPSGRRKGPTDLTGVARLVATDVEHEWFIRLRGEGVALLDTATWLDHDDHHTRVLARGTASDLVLALFGRVPFDVLEIAGETSLLDALRAG